jgi:hypothetical protein
MHEWDDFDELARVDALLEQDELELDNGVGLEIGRSLTSSGALAVDSGVCRACGCTDDEPCPGGCIWATPNADLCSRCAREQ